MELERLFRTIVRGGVKMKKYKIVNKKRFLIFLITLFVIIISIISLLKPSNRAYSSILEEEHIEIAISKGDTLWDIALEYMPEKYDVRKMIYNIKRINKMESSYIFPGDIIKIPIIE